MVNYHDPAVIVQDSLVAIKLWHTVSGLYIWEFFATLDYEWSVIRGRRPYRWTIWIYSLARVAALGSIILGFILVNNTRPINCQAAYSIDVVLSLLSMSASSLLIAFRAIAVWNRNRIVVAIAIAVWGIDNALLIQCAARLRFAWAPVQQTCLPENTDISTLNLIAMLVTDVTLLVIMLVGLIRLSHHDGGAFGLTQLLWRQGVIWLALATAAEVPPVVFIILNLNDPLNVMFQPPSWITMVIAATRMHRSLVDFAHESTHVVSTYKSPQDSSLLVADSKLTPTVSIPLDQMEMDVHSVVSEHPTPQMGNDDLPMCISSDEQMHKRPELV